MNILYYFADRHTYMTEWQHIHIINELEHHNVHIDIFNPLDYECLDKANEELVKILINNSKYDLFMNCCPTTQLYKTTMKELQNITIPKLLICFDNLHAAYIHKDIIPYFDLVWLTSYENEKDIQKWNPNTIFLPYAANPYKYVAGESKDIKKICFIGTPYGTRTIKINHLLHNDIPVDVYFGNINQIKHSESRKSSRTSLPIPDLNTLYNYLSTSIGRRLMYSRFLAMFHDTKIDVNNDCYKRGYSMPFEDMISTYSDYALSLNVLELRNTYLLKNPSYKLHLRTFEIPMCGGIQLTTYNQELSGYFEEGKEIVFYHSEEDFIDKARFYLRQDNTSLRNDIRLAARKRAESEHTWWSRFKKVFDALNLKY